MTQVIEELYSDDNWYKAEIQSRDDDVLEVVIFKWTHEIVPDYGEVCPPFWARVAGGPSITHSLSTARALGVEELSRLSGSVGWKSSWSCPDDENEEVFEFTPGAEEASEGVNQYEDTSESHPLELLRSIASMTLFLTVLAFLLFVSPFVWWFYDPAWAIGAAITSVVLSGLIPFRHFFEAILFVNLIYCAFAVGKLIFF